MLYCILGNSGSGKNTILEKLLKKPELNLGRVVTCTTRPMREKEIPGQEYHYIDISLAIKMMNSNMVVEARRYKVNSGEYWYYFTPDFCLNKDMIQERNLICVTSPDQFGAYFKAFPGQVIPIIITVSDKIRLIRSLSRESNPDCKEICRRYLADTEDYSCSYTDVEPMFKFSNDGDDIDELVDYICEKIGKSSPNSIMFNDDIIPVSVLADGNLFGSLIYNNKNKPESIIKDVDYKTMIKMEDMCNE